MTGYSSTKDKCDTVLTVDMVDVVGAYLWVVCLFPAQGQFVSDAVSKRLWFRKPAANTKYLQNNFRNSPKHENKWESQIHINTKKRKEKKYTGSFHKLTNLWSGQEFLSYKKKCLLQSTKLTFCVTLNTLHFQTFSPTFISRTYTHRFHVLGSRWMHEYVSILGVYTRGDTKVTPFFFQKLLLQ